MNNYNLTPWQFIWNFLKNFKLYILVFALIAVVYAIEVALNPYLLKVILDRVANNDDPYCLISELIRPVIFYISLSLILNLNFRIYYFFSVRFYPVLKARITKHMLEYLIDHSYIFFQNHFAGSLTKKVFDMTSSIELICKRVIESIFPILLSLVTSCVMLVLVVHKIFAIILISWSVLFVGVSYLISRKLGYASKNFSESNVKLSGGISDIISNITSIKLLSAQNYELNGVQTDLNKVLKQESKLYWEYNLVSFIQSVFSTILTALMIMLLIYGRIYDIVTVGDFALVLTLSISIIMRVSNLSQQIPELAQMAGVILQSINVMQKMHDITEIENAPTLKVYKGVIELKGVNFSFDGKEALFKKLSIKINAGEKVGLVGYSGGGKSTFFKLILRLLDVDEGSILIDDQEISKVKISSLTDNITVIPQETDLFHRSIMDNIKLAKPEASDEEVEEAARLAYCHQFISELPYGYDTIIGERGIKLSGGQKQRISIARAFLKNSAILMLDEATASLDSITETYIEDSLHQLMQGKTTLVIGHRMSTLTKMDRILVFDNGCIVADGSIKELLQNKDSIFSKLWNIQSNKLK